MGEVSGTKDKNRPAPTKELPLAAALSGQITPNVSASVKASGDPISGMLGAVRKSAKRFDKKRGK